MKSLRKLETWSQVCNSGVKWRHGVRWCAMRVQATPANWPYNHESIGKKGWAFLLPTVTPEDARLHFPDHHSCKVCQQLCTTHSVAHVDAAFSWASACALQPTHCPMLNLLNLATVQGVHPHHTLHAAVGCDHFDLQVPSGVDYLRLTDTANLYK